MNLDHGIPEKGTVLTINRLSGKIEDVLKGWPAHLCMMALADVVSRAMVEETVNDGYLDAFSSFMRIVAKEVAFRQALKTKA